MKSLLRHAALVFSAFAMSAIPAVPALAAETVPQSVQKMEQAGFTIGRHFDAGHGLTGWILTNAKGATVVYTTSDGQDMLMGALFDANGKNLSEGFVKQYASNPDYEKAYPELAGLHAIVQGEIDHPRRVIDVIFDPNCPYCSVAWNALQPYISMGVQIRWIPVAYLAPDSTAKAAAILSAANPVDALKLNEETFDQDNHKGGIVAATVIPDWVKASVQRDAVVLQHFHSTATPTFIWKNAQGHVEVIAGLPPPLKIIDIVSPPAQQ